MVYSHGAMIPGSRPRPKKNKKQVRKPPVKAPVPQIPVTEDVAPQPELEPETFTIGEIEQSPAPVIEEPQVPEVIEEDPIVEKEEEKIPEPVVVEEEKPKPVVRKKRRGRRKKTTKKPTGAYSPSQGSRSDDSQ